MLPGGNYDKGMTVTKQVGGMNVTEVEYNNEGLKEVGLNADMKSLLNNADDMRSIWPQLVDWATMKSCYMVQTKFQEVEMI
jgi:hypothetical protein